MSTVSRTDVTVRGLMVSRTGFTKTAKAFADDSGVRLMAEADFFKMSLDADRIANSIIREFEASAQAATYVDLSCTVHEYGSGTIYKPVEKFLDDYVSSTKRIGAAILGNFGTGKTTLCKHYAYLNASRWVKGSPDARLPIYISLRDARDLFEIERLTRDAIRMNYGVTAAETVIESWIDGGKLLLLLDGLDEMAAHMDRAYLNKNLGSLRQRFTDASARVILTCRTHFFKTQVDEGVLGDAIRLYMMPWGAQEVLEYVGKSQGGSAERDLVIIDNTYNLGELAKTPMFLNMIVETIGNVEGAVDPTRLYELYTSRWIDAQDYRSVLDREEKLFLMEAMALEFFDCGDESGIAHADIPRLVKRIFGISD
ncbi:MAG: NACHT domain-containing protein, partial [Actinobacteria bacterium]|nr:NACHT domain-containing protein [Actinomycetota bacterium]